MTAKPKSARERSIEAQIAEYQRRVKGYRSLTETPYTKVKIDQLTAELKRLRAELKRAAGPAAESTAEEDSTES